MKVPISRRKCLSELHAKTMAEHAGVRDAKALTSKLNAVYGKESSKVDLPLMYAQLGRLSREAW